MMTGWRPLTVAILVSYSVLLLLVLVPQKDREWVVFIVTAFVLMPLFILFSFFLMFSEPRTKGSFFAGLGLMIVGALGCPMWWYIIIFSHTLLSRYVASRGAIAILVVLTAIGILLVIRGNKVARAAQNPLRGLFSDRAAQHVADELEPALPRRVLRKNMILMP